MRFGCEGRGRHGAHGQWHAGRGGFGGPGGGGFGGPFGFGWESEGGPRGGWGGGGRGPRRFEGGELRLILLRLIADESRHGYELIRAIEEMTGGTYVPSPGVIYPALTMLDDMDLIAAQQSNTSKKRFAVTDAGQQHLAERQDEVDALMARLADLGADRKQHQGSPVWRAVRNLGLVIRDQKVRGVSEDDQHAIAAMIDELAQKIERMK